MAKDDSIYELQYNRTVLVRFIRYILPQVSVQEYFSLFGGDVPITKSVFVMDTITTTNAGGFSNCIMYEYSTPD